MTYNWATYQSARDCTRYGPAGARALLVYLEDRFPGQMSFGICNCRQVSGGSSWSHHAECRAYDEGFKVFVGQTIGIETLELLGPHGAELGIDHLIMNHHPGVTGRGTPRIYSARSPQGRVYTGTHPHKNHNHIGLTRNAGQFLTYAKLEHVLGPANPADIGEGDDMSLLGLDIGKMGDPSVIGLRAGTLQAMLVERGFNLGTFGVHGDGVDQSAGDITREALHDWKIIVGVAAAFSAGSGVIGQYEYAAFHPDRNFQSPNHPDEDHTTLATKQQLIDAVGRLEDQDSVVQANLTRHVGRPQTGPHTSR